MLTQTLHGCLWWLEVRRLAIFDLQAAHHHQGLSRVQYPEVQASYHGGGLMTNEMAGAVWWEGWKVPGQSLFTSNTN